MSDYKVIDGTIVSPGKFEAEPEYAPFYWDSVLNGCSDETIYDGDRPVDVCIVTDEDRRQFPDLVDVYAIGLTESDQGFVTTSPFATVDALNRYRSEMERYADQETE